MLLCFQQKAAEEANEQDVPADGALEGLIAITGSLVQIGTSHPGEMKPR